MNQSILRRAFFSFQLGLLALVFAATTVFAAGEVDPTFNAAVQSSFSVVQKIVVQPDGKFVVVGTFTVAGKSARSAVVRFNVDGTVDETFAPPDFLKKFSIGAPSLTFTSLYAVALQSDGKIIVGGAFDQVGTVQKTGAVRLNADGSLDSSFNPAFKNFTSDPLPGSDQVVYDIEIQPDNKILIGGEFQLVEGSTSRTLLARVNVDGSIDSSFTSVSNPGAVKDIILQSDGKIVYVSRINTGNDRFARVNSDGTSDNSFLPANIGASNRLAVQPDGKILISGQFTKIVNRYNSNGVLDGSFNASGNGPNGVVRDILVLPDGKILIAGSFTTFNNVARAWVARLNGDGSLDTTFNYTGTELYSAYAVALANDGTYLVGGSQGPFVLNKKLVRLNTDGTAAPFIGDVFERGTVYKIFAQADGKIIIGGVFSAINGVARRNIARLNADSSLDMTFNASLNTPASTVAAQADGKVLAGGSFTQVNGGSIRLSIARFNVDSSFDSTFQPPLVNPNQNPNNSIINEIIPLPDGKILIAGKFRLSNYNFDLNVARLNADGTVDTTFNQTQVNISGTVYTMKLQPDGKIVVGGFFSQIAGASRGNVARLNADGTIDTTFNPSSGTNGVVYDLAIQSTGNIVIGGDFNTVNGATNRYYLAQLSPNGSLIPAFYTLVNFYVFAIEKQSDDKILVGSYFNINGKRGIARFNTDGTLDNSFAGIGTNDIVRDIFIQSDNNILIGGEFTRVNNVSRVGVARLLNAAAPTARTPYDFDGDGRADISVFRPSNGTWYLQQSTAGFVGYAFGANGDLITPADYDGDGKTDIAVFRNGTWYLQRSSQGFTGIAFGTNGDIPMPGDFDGDGKADLAVFRPSNGVWYLQQSTNGFTGITFGQNGDSPIAADYDGDGKTDIAVFRPSNGTWYLQRSQLGFTFVTFGAGTDKPVPADYNGDGKADIAIFRPSTGYWYTSTDPATNYGATLFGQAGDLPVPADYDGDGKADLAVFRPSNGVWYLQRSTQGFTGVLFGISEDKPAPNAFIR